MKQLSGRRTFEMLTFLWAGSGRRACWALVKKRVCYNPYLVCVFRSCSETHCHLHGLSTSINFFFFFFTTQEWLFFGSRYSPICNTFIVNPRAGGLHTSLPSSLKRRFLKHSLFAAHSHYMLHHLNNTAHFKTHVHTHTHRHAQTCPQGQGPPLPGRGACLQPPCCSVQSVGAVEAYTGSCLTEGVTGE